MSYGDHRCVGPLGVIAALVALGLLGGRRGQRVLDRLKRLLGWAEAPSVPVAVVVGVAIPRREIALGVIAALSWGLIALVFWCYVAFAKWLTGEDDVR